MAHGKSLHSIANLPCLKRITPNKRFGELNHNSFASYKIMFNAVNVYIGISIFL